jgi:hypothetical protein
MTKKSPRDDGKRARDDKKWVRNDGKRVRNDGERIVFANAVKQSRETMLGRHG